MSKSAREVTWSQPLNLRLAGSPFIRLPFLLLTYTLFMPLQRLLHLSPLALPFYNFIGRATDLKKMRGAVFSSYRPCAKDVVVCSYGKSGTNWTLQIAHQIAHRGKGDFGHVHDVIPWPDEIGRGYSIPLEHPGEDSPSPTGMRAIKTHLPAECVPYTAEARYICVVRDPKDVAVSGYHFFKSVLLGPLMLPPDLWVEHFLSGRNQLGSWAEHLAGYWAWRERGNVLFLRYEEMQGDMAGAIDRIAALMGVRLENEERDEVIAQCGFSHMRTIDHKFYPGMVTPLSCPEGKMMRAGKSEGGVSLLGEEQRKRIDTVCRAELVRLGCDFPYDTHYGGKEPEDS